MNLSRTCISTSILRTTFCFLARCALKKSKEMEPEHDDCFSSQSGDLAENGATAGSGIRMGPAALSHVAGLCAGRTFFHASARHISGCLESDLHQQQQESRYALAFMDSG